MESNHHLGMRNGGPKQSRAAVIKIARPRRNAAQAESAVEGKIARLANNPLASPRVLDLFSGCGGLSLGFKAAGYEIVGAMEIDELAARSHAINFFKGSSASIIEHHAKPRDITAIDPSELIADLGLGEPSLAIDVIVGGPPCQAYARVGRAKLREIAEHPEAFKIDPRANLYLRYLHYVEQLKPLAILLENVPDILNFGGHNIVQEIVEALDGMGYVAKYSLISSAHHGVPQMRDRVYMIALRKELDASVEFPSATHYCDLPPGYEGTRAVALKRVDLFGHSGWEDPDIGHKDLPKAVTASEAISDLPPITLHREGKLKRGARRFTELSRYRKIAFERLSSFAQAMRSWRGFEGGEGVYDHVLRYLPRDTLIFEAMQQGDEYPAAHKVAQELFLTAAKRKGHSKNTVEWNRLYRAMVPPYDPTKFPNRWWKLRENGPARTLMAHIGKDTYSHIHYDDRQARVITVREAARLQSFPDGFMFAGTMNPAFRQIGNAVPPVMAHEIAKSMLEMLNTALLSAKIDILAAE